MKIPLGRSVGGGSIWGRWSLAVALAAGLSLGFASNAQGATSPDVAVTQPGPNDPAMTSLTMLAQTVKAQHDGQLYEVDVRYGNSSFGSGATLQIWSLTSQGVPLAPMPSASLAVPKVGFTPDWHPFTLPSRIRIQANEKYAIVLIGSNRWSYNTGAGYTNGQMFNLARGTWGAYSLGSGAAFLFRTWVDASLQTPSITADRPSGTSADEATRPTMTGSYTNPAGGAVKLQADHGQASDLGGGKWSWTGDVYDEDTAPSTITVTLTDSLNQTATTLFPLTITRLKPTASITGSGFKAAAATTTSAIGNPEGSKLTLNGSATSADPADQAGAFTYRWTVNGVVVPGTGAASLTLTTTDEGDTFAVSLSVTDDGGMPSDPVSVTVVGNEITPSATITGITPSDTMLSFVAPQETLNFNGTFTDPAPEPHTFRWDFGDGGFATTLAASHAYAAGGTYTVTLTVRDDEKVAGTATATVKVLTTQQALAAMIAYVQGVNTLNAGQQNSLIAKLNAASDSAARGDNRAAGNELNAFLNELEADQKTGRISAGAYNTLRADAHALQGALGTFNRFLEWWPLPA